MSAKELTRLTPDLEAIYWDVSAGEPIERFFWEWVPVCVTLKALGYKYETVDACCASWSFRAQTDEENGRRLRS